MASRKKIKKGISDVDIIIMKNLKNYDDLVRIFLGNLTNPELSKNIIYRVLHTIISNDVSKALEVIKLLPCDLRDKSYVALIIKIYAMNKMMIEALTIYKSIPEDERKKRFVIVIYNEIAKTDKKAAFDLLINEIYNKFVITEEDIKKVYDIQWLDEILKIMSDNDIIIEDTTFFNNTGVKVNIIDKKCSCCGHELKKFNLTFEERDNLKSNLRNEYLYKLQNKTFAFKEINKLDAYLTRYTYNVFIDGNNILFFKDREVNIDSYRRLEIIYNHLQAFNQPLIFIHQRHRNNIKKMGEKSKEAYGIINRLPIYFTPYKMNDDWFFIWAGITVPNSYVVTNDMLRDHIFKISEESIISNTLSTWIDSYVIRYELLDNNYELRYPKEYSTKVQNCDGIWHIPSTTGWVCLSK